MAYQTISFNDFMQGRNGSLTPSILLDKITQHLNRHKMTYRIIGTTIIILLTTADMAFAASTGIDIKGRQIYKKLLSIGKWIIIIKAAFDTISKVVKGDFESAKKSILAYLFVYVILLGFPWALETVESVFSEEAI